MDAVTYRLRPGKSPERYVEPLVHDDGRRVHTRVEIDKPWPIAPKGSGWRAGVPTPRYVAKYLFYDEWFAIMQWQDADGRPYLHYCDVCTPVRKRGGEYYYEDLFLDLVIRPDGHVLELDRDELLAAVAAEVISEERAAHAEATLSRLRAWAERGGFPHSHTAEHYPAPGGGSGAQTT